MISNLIGMVAEFLAGKQRIFINFVRVAICIVMLWIGGLKAFQYEADGIVHFVANSPFMSFFYKDSQKMVENDKGELVKEYTLYKNPEGKMVQKNIDWHKQNGTYPFSYGLRGCDRDDRFVDTVRHLESDYRHGGGLLTFGMSIVTLSFLITTPETYVPNLGGDLPTPNYGFPYLSGAGRLILKDIIMMAGGLIAASECAQRYLKARA